MNLLFARFPDAFCITQECDPLGASPVDLCSFKNVSPKGCPAPSKMGEKVAFPSTGLDLSPQREEKRKRERDPLVFVPASLSNGINGGLMGYERMFYWKQ